MTVNPELASARLKAAQITEGISTAPTYAAVLKEVKRRRANGYVLDYGAGVGNFSRILCQEPEFSCVTAADIVDYPGRYQSPKLRWEFADLNATLSDHQERYNTVVSVEVIEHLENPRAVVRDWFQMLKPGGTLIFSTPNNESWRAILSLVFKRHFIFHVDEWYPNHISALLRTDMERILTEAGFHHVDFSFSDNGLVPKVTRLTWQQISGDVLKGVRYSDNVVCSAVKPAVSSITELSSP